MGVFLMYLIPKTTEHKKKTRYVVIHVVVVKKKGNIPGLKSNAPPAIKNMADNIKLF